MLEPVTISPASVCSTDAADLIAQLDMELAQRYPDIEHSHSKLTPEQFGPGQGMFLIASTSAGPVGCGAVCKLDNTTGQITRMYVRPLARGARVGHSLLIELERYSWRSGIRRLVLVTGKRQPEAIRLYERFGFVRVPKPSAYSDSPVRIWMAKALTWNMDLIGTTMSVVETARAK